MINAKLAITFLLAAACGLCQTNSNCDKIIAAVATDKDFGDETAQLNSCSELLRTTIDELTGLSSDDLSPEPNINFIKNSKHYPGNKEFGWKEKDSYFDRLNRMHTFLAQFIDRANSNADPKANPLKLFTLPFGSGRRLRRELVDRGSKTPDEDSARIRTNLEVAQHYLTRIMEDNGLTEPFSALLETYFVPYSTAGSNAIPTALTGLNQKTQTFAAGFLSFESDHFQARQAQLGAVSIGGRIGLTPVETLVTVSNTDAKPKAYLQNAFNWSLNARWTKSVGTKAFLASLFTFGQNILLSDSSVVAPAAAAAGAGAPATATTTAPFGNYTQSGAWFWELGPELRIYPYQLYRVVEEKKFLLPSFSFATGVRMDQRFSSLQETPANSATLGNFTRPRQRWFLRSFVTLTNVRERNQSKKSVSDVFNVGIGYEYDTVWGFPANTRNTVPANSRIYINASIDIVKAFSKQGS